MNGYRVLEALKAPCQVQGYRDLPAWLDGLKTHAGPKRDVMNVTERA